MQLKLLLPHYGSLWEKNTMKTNPEPLTKDERTTMDALDMLSEYICDDENKVNETGLTGDAAKILGKLHIKEDKFNDWVEKQEKKDV